MNFNQIRNILRNMPVPTPERKKRLIKEMMTPPEVKRKPARENSLYLIPKNPRAASLDRRPQTYSNYKKGKLI